MVLHKFDFPSMITKYWSIFRSTGRISWIAVYVLMFCGCIMLCKAFKKSTAFIVIFLCICLQSYDIHNKLHELNGLFSHKAEYKSLLTDSSFWNMAADNDKIKHIVFTLPIGGEELYSFTDWAMSNGKTVNWFYFARSDGNIFHHQLQKALEKPDNTTLFIFFEDNQQQCFDYDLNYYAVDGYIIGYAETFENFQRLIPEQDLNTDGLWELLSNYWDSKDKMIYLSAMDEASLALDHTARTAFAQRGLHELSALEYRDSYLAVINNGQIIYEQKGHDTNPIEITVGGCYLASGGDSGNVSSIMIDGEEYSPKKRGINVVVYDKEANQLIESVFFDTFLLPVHIPEQ